MSDERKIKKDEIRNHFEVAQQIFSRDKREYISKTISDAGRKEDIFRIKFKNIVDVTDKLNNILDEKGINNILINDNDGACISLSKLSDSDNSYEGYEIHWDEASNSYRIEKETSYNTSETYVNDERDVIKFIIEKCAGWSVGPLGEI